MPGQTFIVSTVSALNPEMPVARHNTIKSAEVRFFMAMWGGLWVGWIGTSLRLGSELSPVAEPVFQPGGPGHARVVAGPPSATVRAVRINAEFRPNAGLFQQHMKKHTAV